MVAALVTGCGGSGQAKSSQATAEPTQAAPEALSGPIDAKVTMEGWENPSDLGIVTAVTAGFFVGADRNIWVAVPDNPNRPVRYVSDGTDTFGVAQLPQVVIAREKGAPIVAIGSLVSQPTTAMIWLKRSKIHKLADLKGKTIAIPGLPYQKRFLAAVLARAGLSLQDVRLDSVGYNLVPALLSGKVDASFGGSWNLEGVTLEERGASPVIRRVQSFGFPSYEELVVITRRDLLSRRPRLVRDFLSAMHRGSVTALENPEAAVRFMKGADETNPEDDWKVTEGELTATLPLLSRTSRMDLEKANALVRWMREQGMLQHPLVASELLTNTYLPHEAKR